MEFQTIYHRLRKPRLSFDGEAGVSRTQQQFRDECDINYMIRRALTGDGSVFRKGSYGDFRDIPQDLHEVQNKLAFAQSVWNDLPDKVRQTVGTPENLLAELDRRVADSKKEKAKAIGASEKISEKSTHVTDEKKTSASPSMDAAHASATT